MNPRVMGVVYLAVVPYELDVVQDVFYFGVLILLEFLEDGGEVHGILN